MAAAMCSLLAIPSPSQPHLHLSPSPFNAPSALIRFRSSKKLRPPPLCPASTSTSASTSAVEDGDRAPPFSGCKACGREEVERGCNGEGRIQGGIATVPGFGWWPIKAYKPCPGFLASGGRYFRQGQTMDEVVSGRGGPAKAKATTYAGSSDGPDGKSEPSKTKRDPRRAKK